MDAAPSTEVPAPPAAPVEAVVEAVSAPATETAPPTAPLDEKKAEAAPTATAPAPVLLPKPSKPGGGIPLSTGSSSSSSSTTTTTTTSSGSGGGAPEAPPRASSVGAGGGSAASSSSVSSSLKELGKKDEGMHTLACGTGGVDEMRKALPDEALPYFGMLRLTVGEGTYAREKTILVTYAPDACPGVKKAKAAAKKNDVRKALGDVHSEWMVTSPGDLSVGPMLEALKFMVADSTKGGVSIAKMKSDYEAMIQASAAAALGGGLGGKGGAKVDIKNATGRLTAAEMDKKIPSHAALKAVRDTLGPFNWALFAPTEAGKDLEFINAGSLSVNECVKWLKDDENYYGILRMGFGEGKFRRTKWIFFTYSGPKVGVVKRSKANNAKSNMKSALGPCSVDMQVTSVDELSLPLVIDKVKKIPGVDGESTSEANEVNMDNFMKALEEEAKAASDFFGDGKAPEPTGKGRVVGDVVGEIRKGKGINWALFGV